MTPYDEGENRYYASVEGKERLHAAYLKVKKAAAKGSEIYAYDDTIEWYNYNPPLVIDFIIVDVQNSLSEVTTRWESEWGNINDAYREATEYDLEWPEFLQNIDESPWGMVSMLLDNDDLRYMYNDLREKRVKGFRELLLATPIYQAIKKAGGKVTIKAGLDNPKHWVPLVSVVITVDLPLTASFPMELIDANDRKELKSVTRRARINPDSDHVLAPFASQTRTPSPSLEAPNCGYGAAAYLRDAVTTCTRTGTSINDCPRLPPGNHARA